MKPLQSLEKGRLPIVLVAGFLGAGKTTLMRHLIRDCARRGLRAQVVVNEFGVADVDSNILREADAELLGSIAGGCACCSGADELIFTLLEAGETYRDAPPEKRADVLLLEASGLADPVSMLDTLTAAMLLPLVRLGAMVSVVDACRLPEMTKRSGEIAPLLCRQVQFADLIVLNKTDISFAPRKRAEQIESAQLLLRGLNPAARIEPTRGAVIETEAFWPRVLEESPATPDSSRSEFSASDAAHTHYQTVAVPMPRGTKRAQIEAQLRDLGADVWRAKGFLTLEDEALYLLQYVGGALGGFNGKTTRGEWQITPFPFPEGFAAPESILVFIGPRLDRTRLMRDFAGREVVTLL